MLPVRSKLNLKLWGGFMRKYVYPQEYYEFFVKFNEADYYTCHDLLEEMWLADRGNQFLKGLLQMSVAIYHYEYGNVKGARLMFKRAEECLVEYRPLHWGLDLEVILLFLQEALSIIPDDIDSVPYNDMDDYLPKLTVPALFLEEV
jgi:predicted metal-dependent hydrolase